jgi:hypothetical protein
MSDEIVDEVLETLHEYSNICVGADTCNARQAIAPLVNEIERLKTAPNPDLERLQGLYQAQTENYHEENEARAAAQERVKELEISLGAERALKRDLEMKLSEAALLAEMWMRSINRLVKTMGADLKQVLDD